MVTERSLSTGFEDLQDVGFCVQYMITPRSQRTLQTIYSANKASKSWRPFTILRISTLLSTN